jgi:hypothetical protein
MNFKKSPGYSLVISPWSARPIRLTFMYCPSYRMDPLMSITTTVAHLGLFLVLWISKSSDRNRTGNSPGLLSIALMTDCVVSKFAIESPKSYGLVDGSSTLPSPTILPSCRPDRDAFSCEKIRARSRL